MGGPALGKAIMGHFRAGGRGTIFPPFKLRTDTNTGHRVMVSHLAPWRTLSSRLWGMFSTTCIHLQLDKLCMPPPKLKLSILGTILITTMIALSWDIELHHLSCPMRTRPRWRPLHPTFNFQLLLGSMGIGDPGLHPQLPLNLTLCTQAEHRIRILHSNLSLLMLRKETHGKISSCLTSTPIFIHSNPVHKEHILHQWHQDLLLLPHRVELVEADPMQTFSLLWFSNKGNPWQEKSGGGRSQSSEVISIRDWRARVGSKRTPSNRGEYKETRDFELKSAAGYFCGVFG